MMSLRTALLKLKCQSAMPVSHGVRGYCYAGVPQQSTGPPSELIKLNALVWANILVINNETYQRN